MWQYMNPDELYRHGVLGMKWGVRRYRNENGSLTSAGQKRVMKLDKKITKQGGKINKYQNKSDKLTKRNAPKIAKLNKKAAKYERKAYGRFTKKSKSDEYLFKAGKFNARAKKKASKIDHIESKISKSKAKINRYNRKLSKLDPNHIDMGQQYIESLMTRKNQKEVE